MYDFKTTVNRSKQGSMKWLQMLQNNPTLDTNIVPLSVADTDLMMAPEIVKGLQEYLETMILGYTEPTKEYYDAVENWMKRRHNWKIEKDWIVLSPGVVAALYNVVSAFTEENDGVIIMSPVYYPFKLSIENQKRKVIENHLLYDGNHYRIDYEGLEALARDSKNKLLIFCSPHNPVGRVWSAEELLKVNEICSKNNVLILSDEIHFDLIMPGYKHTVFATLNKTAENNCIIATAPSKSFNLAGLQTANLVIPNDEIRNTLKSFLEKSGSQLLNAIGPKACELAYNFSETWLDEFVEHIDSNRRIFKTFIEEKLPQIKVIELEGTYLQWFDCSGLNMDDATLNNFLVVKCNLYLDPGNMFGESGKLYQRMNIACSEEKLLEALNRLLKNVKEII